MKRCVRQLLGSMLMFLLFACHVSDPVAAVSKAGFSLPRHFEVQLPATGSAVLPEGTVRLLPVISQFDPGVVVHDLRSLRAIMSQLVAPPGMRATPVPRYTKVEKTPDGIISRHVVRLVASEATPGSRLSITGEVSLLRQGGEDDPVASRAWERTVEVTTYQPTADMVELDRQAALFYIKDSLSRYDAFLKAGEQLPWEVPELEAHLAQMSSVDRSRYLLLLQSRQRASEARLHLAAASKSPDPAIAEKARQALRDVESAFSSWKAGGVPPPPQLSRTGQWFGGERSGNKQFHHIQLVTDEFFRASHRWHESSRLWLSPVGSGLRWEGRGAVLGTAPRKSTAMINTLSGHVAVLPWWLIEAQLPLLTVTSSTGEVWQSRLLNPAVALGFVVVDRQAWRLRLRLGYAADLDVGEDLRVAGFMTPDIPQWTNVRSHSFDVSSTVEWNVSQYSFAVQVGGQSVAAVPASRGGRASTRFEDPPFLIHYNVMANVWVMPAAALQLDFHGRVFTTGSRQVHIGGAGFGLAYHGSDQFSARLGLFAPYGEDASFSSIQLHTGLAWTWSGSLAGEE